MVEAVNWYNQIPYPPGLATHKLENNYIQEFFSCHSPQPGGLAQGRGTLRTFVLEDHRGLTRWALEGERGLGEGTSLTQGTCKTSHMPGPRAKAVIGEMLGPHLPDGLIGSPQRGGRGWLWPRLCVWTMVADTLGKYSAAWAIMEDNILTPRPGSKHQTQDSSATRPQPKQQTG